MHHDDHHDDVKLLLGLKTQHSHTYISKAVFASGLQSNTKTHYIKKCHHMCIICIVSYLVGKQSIANQ